jgi:phosphate transport system permease protein
MKGEMFVDDLYTAKMVKKDGHAKILYTSCGLFIIILTVAIGAFLIYKGSGTFVTAHHTVWEFLFSSEWDPTDSVGSYGGKVGALVYICGSLMTCGLALVFAIPFAVGTAVYLAEINPKFGEKFIRPAAEIYVGIPSVVYGWVGLTVLVPFIRDVFHAKMGGFSVLAASIVLAVMIFPTITTVAADAIQAVPQSYREAAYGMGSTRWQVIRHVVLPAAFGGIATGVILGLARAIGEALAVAMVIGKTRSFPANILSPTNNLTAAIAADMGNTANGGEHNMALWSMALLLYIISTILIFIIHRMSHKKED